VTTVRTPTSECGTNTYTGSSPARRTCFYVGCERKTRDKFCREHGAQAKRWLREERKLDSIEDRRHPEVSSWDWADWDWNYAFDTPGYHGQYLATGYRTVKPDEGR
jgi:hypothetical protein